MSAPQSSGAVEPKPGQVWTWADGEPAGDIFMLIAPDSEGRAGDWHIWDIPKGHKTSASWFGMKAPSLKHDKLFLRWATPAECRAAGLDPEKVLPTPPAAAPQKGGGA